VSVFIDTAILVYAHDERAAEKHLVANRLVRELWKLPVLPVISVQVCKELWRTLSRSRALDREVLACLVENYLQWRVVPEDGALLAAAFELRRQHGLPVWDSWIVAAAQRAGVRQLWSDGLEAGRCFGAVEVINPLVRGGG
jgi:predicted nucleic acid-binding protein